MSDFENLALDRKRSPVALILSLIAALFITTALLSGYLYLRKRHQAEVRATQQSQERPAQSPPKAEVIENEALLKGSQAIISGSVRNISQEQLADLSIELELRRRTGAGSEIHTVQVVPDDLAPGQQGDYSLGLDSHSYSGAKILKLRSGSQSSSLAFRTLPGTPRPPERIQQSNTIVIVKPSPRHGEEFINTPDNPSHVP
ncbi:MAG TPA: hypothetical protein VK619_11175 [Pyrinomonadaceae bacterium]|nr:hypothetical protein [Pyrinomonadaceae bacterium]